MLFWSGLSFGGEQSSGLSLPRARTVKAVGPSRREEDGPNFRKGRNRIQRNEKENRWSIRSAGEIGSGKTTIASPPTKAEHIEDSKTLLDNDSVLRRTRLANASISHCPIGSRARKFNFVCKNDLS